jgi:DNA-binding transcriptional ArsR family regulator
MTERFAKLPKAAVFELSISAECVRVLAAIAVHTNKQNRCYVLPATIARRLGLSVRQVQRHLKALRAAGFIAALGSQKNDDGNLVKMLLVRYAETSSDDALEFSQTTSDDVLPSEETSSDDATSDAEASSDDAWSGRKRHRMAGKTSSDDAPRTRQLNEPLSSERGKGSRYVKTGILPSAWREFARQERPELDPDKVFAKFEDYWTGITGSKSIKRDWTATWRNWCRSERAPISRPASKGQALRDALDRQIEEADRDA